MASKILIKNPFLSAITYHYCYNLPPEEVKKLSIKYRRMLASQAKTKAFCDKSSIDEKLQLFNAIGLNTGLTILPDKVRSGVSLKEILNNYESEKLAAAQKEQSNLGCYVVTDKDTSYMLSMMGQTINHESYIRSLDYSKTGNRIKNWTKQLDSPGQNELLETIENSKIIANTLLNTGLNFENIKVLFGVNNYEMKVLLFMYQRRQSYISKENIVNYFDGYLTKARVTRAIKKLVLNSYFDKHQDWRTRQYTISSKGLTMVGEFINSILKQNQF